MREQADHAILLTAPGSAAIAVVRVVGPGVKPFLDQCFSRPPRRLAAIHGQLQSGQSIIDDPVVMLIDEDTADMCLHGGPWVVRSVLDLLARRGFSIAERMSAPLPLAAIDDASEIESEMLAWLPMAKTELALRALLAQPAAWERSPPDQWSFERIEQALADQSLGRLLHTPRAAIVGAANVGKSTLANQLFGQERSITADMPGTTRDWVGEPANLGGLAVLLVDTPGQRRTQDFIERAAIDRAAAEVEQADLVIVLLDASRPLDAEQLAPLQKWPGALVAINKLDRPAAWTPGDLPESVDANLVLSLTATLGTGVGTLIDTIRTRLGCDPIDLHVPRCWTDRQRDLLRRLAAAHKEGMSTRSPPAIAL